MLEEFAQVVEVHQDYVVVSSSRANACHACQAQSNCGQRTLTELFGKRSITLKLKNPNGLPLNVGQTVVLGLHEQAILISSLVMYLTPVLFLILATAIAYRIDDAEAFIMLGSLVGLLLGFFTSRKLSKKLLSNPDYTPKLLKIAQ